MLSPDSSAEKVSDETFITPIQQAYRLLEKARQRLPGENAEINKHLASATQCLKEIIELSQSVGGAS
jgi:hypothetical protein